VRALALGLVLCALVAPAQAEDIDIYANPNAANDVPNVLFVLDNSANWSSSIPAADCFYKEGRCRLGGRPEGEQPRPGAGQEDGDREVRPLQPDRRAAGRDQRRPRQQRAVQDRHHAAERVARQRRLSAQGVHGAHDQQQGALKALIKGLAVGDDKGSNADFAKAMYEAYLYFKGLPPYQGQLAPKRDSAAFNGGHYDSPAGASCSRNYVIFIANGSPENSENNNALALLTAAGGNTSALSYPTSIVKSTDQNNWMDEYARFLRSADVSSNDGSQGIITHTVAVTGAVVGRPLSELHAGGRQPGRRHLPQRQRRRHAAQVAARGLQRDPGGQQRVRLGQPAGLGQRAAAPT
jgi:type IV pilus assembly protein PilY1